MKSGEINISIIIVTFNSLPAIQDCLAHLKEAVPRISHELIIVDNNSIDNSPSLAKTYWPKARIIINKKNLGFASACNQGAKEAGGEYLLFVNPDVFLDSHCIGEFLGFMHEKDKVGAVGGRLRWPDGIFQPTCRNLPTLSNLLFSRGSVMGKLFRSSLRYTLPDAAVVSEVPAVAGALFVIRKSVFEKAGRFDSNFFMYMEDTDLCKRLSRLGFTNYFLPSAGAVHEWGKGSSAGTIKRKWYHHCSVFSYFRKHQKGPVTLIILPVMLAVNFLITILLDLMLPFKK